MKIYLNRDWKFSGKDDNFEVAYMTNRSDLEKLKSETFLENAGKAIAQGILESF